MRMQTVRYVIESERQKEKERNKNNIKKMLKRRKNQRNEIMKYIHYAACNTHDLIL